MHCSNFSLLFGYCPTTASPLRFNEIGDDDRDERLQTGDVRPHSGIVRGVSNSKLSKATEIQLRAFVWAQCDYHQVSWEELKKHEKQQARRN